jgi:urocanate hydratase
MSGAQPKAGIAGCITVCVEVNPKITQIRHSQGWINEVVEDINELVKSFGQSQQRNGIYRLSWEYS